MLTRTYRAALFIRSIAPCLICWLRSLYPKSAVEEGALQKIRLVNSDVADHLRAALRASRALFLLRAAQPIRGVKADRGLGSQGAKPRPDLVEQKLPDLAIRQSCESVRQDSGDQHGGGEPLHWVAGAQAPPLFLDQFPDVQFLSPLAVYGATGKIVRKVARYRRFPSKTGRFSRLLRTV